MLSLVGKSCSFLGGTRRAQRIPKDCVAERGDVDIPLECSLASGMVAAEARKRIAEQEAAGTFPWIGTDAWGAGQAHRSPRSATCYTRKRRPGRLLVLR